MRRRVTIARSDQRVVFAMQAAKRGVVHPVLLNELELSRDVSIQADEVNTLVVVIGFLIGTTAAQYPMTIADAPAFLGVIAERVSRVGTPDVRTDGTPLAVRIVAVHEVVRFGRRRERGVV